MLALQRNSAHAREEQHEAPSDVPSARAVTEVPEEGGVAAADGSSAQG